MAKPTFEEPGHYTDKDREKIDSASFGDPAGKRFPIVVARDVQDASHLLGKVQDPEERERIKARIIEIAKRKGFPIPDAWQERAAEPVTETRSAETRSAETRSADPARIEPVFMAPITRIDPDKRLVTVTATSEAVDSFGTVFDYEASKDAFLRWVGNIREMHQPKAVGTRVGVHCDDASRKIDVTLRISKGAQDTWEKILDGTLKGASIGASNVTWEQPIQRDGGRAAPRARKYSLVELSLVDNPSNPDCLGISVMRNALPDLQTLDLLDEQEQQMAERAAVAAQAEADAVAAMPLVASATTNIDLPVPTPPTPTPTPEPVAAAAAVVDAATGAPTTAAATSERDAAFAAVAQDIRASRRPLSSHEQRVARIEARRALEDEIRAAGEAAEREVGPPQRGEDYVLYAARVAQARGAAEQRVLLAQKLRAQPAQPSAEAPVEPTASEPASEERNAAIIEMAAVPADATDATGGHTASGTGEPVGSEASLHDDADQTPLDQSGADALHEHEHVHADGTRHSHPHAHTGPHEHSHSYRAGQPTDSRILLADAQAGAQASRAYASLGQDDGVSAQSKARPVSGSAQASGKVESGLEKLTPSAVGHPVGYNTQTMEQVGFGVPHEAASIPASPDLSGGDLALDPAAFHPGGHGGEASAQLDQTAPGGFDRDGDHDGDEDEREAANGPRHASEAPMAAAIPGTRRPTPGEGRAAMPKLADDKKSDKSEADNDGDHDGDADDAEPGDALAATSESGDESEQAEGRATADADETRAGARISAESRRALHMARDTQVNAVKAVCEHCACDECNAHLEALAAAANQPAPLEEGGMALSGRSAVADFAQRRMLAALVERAVSAAVSAAVTEITNALTSHQRQVTTRLADLELTLADLQTHATRQSSAAAAGSVETRAQAAETQRMTGLIERALETRLAAALTPITAQLDAVASLGEGLKAVGGVVETVGEMAERIRRIEQQPSPTALLGPTAGIADRRLALDPSAATRAVSGPSTEEQIALLTEIGRNSTDRGVQMEMATRIAQLTNPRLR